eukprot:m51a1_g11404 hypothetical protein (744) ;mRNA; f:2093-4713
MSAASADTRPNGTAKKPFGYYVFDDKTMERHVPDAAYKKMRAFIQHGGALDFAVADAVAFGMKEWAVSRGATSFTHWFHPLNDKTAVKYDAFLVLKNHLGYSGRNLSQFTGKQLVQGEPDGSSFPSGGLRSTSEARGYTAWDYTSPPFVIVTELGGCLYIPAVFCSVFGLSLDVRTPMLKSEYAVSQASIRALGLLRQILHEGPGSPRAAPSTVYASLGPEQELFLIDRAKYEARPDLVNTGRILLGAAPVRGQQLEEHYWGTMPMRVRHCLETVQERLWELGVPIVTMHNEVAPGQFEMAPCYERASVAADHNMITMQVMMQEAERHGLAALLHEKPFSRYVNGSGKHANWSLATNEGENLFCPGDEPENRTQFLFFLAAFLRAAHVHTDLLRTAIAVPGNEFRLGGMEAPPAIISVFLGEFLNEVVNEIIAGPPKSRSPADGHPCRSTTPSPCSYLDLGLATLPKVQLDGSDRNRTSPLAFVGSRFEFRAVGSSQNPAWPVMIINTIMADSLGVMCDQLEEVLKSGAAPRDALAKVIRETLKAHQDIVYNGDCYDQAYVEEMAKNRGLPNIPSCAAAIALFNSQKNRDVFAKTNVMTPAEVEARSLVLAERYETTRAIEAGTLVNMIETIVIPAALKFQERLATSVRETAAVLGDNAVPNQKRRLATLAAAVEEAIEASAELKEAMHAAHETAEGLPRAFAFREQVMPAMEKAKLASDAIESSIDREYWPLPTVADMFAHF